MSIFHQLSRRRNSQITLNLTTQKTFPESLWQNSAKKDEKKKSVCEIKLHLKITGSCGRDTVTHSSIRPIFPSIPLTRVTKSTENETFIWRKKKSTFFCFHIKTGENSLIDKRKNKEKQQRIGLLDGFTFASRSPSSCKKSKIFHP